MGPVRTCLGCRARDSQDNLLRLVRTGDVIVDGTSPRLPGRGGYLHRNPDCWAAADRRRALQRLFGPGAELAPGLAADCEQEASAR